MLELPYVFIHHANSQKLIGKVSHGGWYTLSLDLTIYMYSLNSPPVLLPCYFSKLAMLKVLVCVSEENSP